MNVLTTNPIVYDSGLIDQDYENALGKRAVNRTQQYENARGRNRRVRGKYQGRQSRPRAGGRPRRTGFNRALSIIPVVGAARYIQNRREERQESQRQSQPSPSARKQSRPPMAQGGQYQGKQSRPSSGSKRPSQIGKPAGKPNVPRQNISQAPMLAPADIKKDNGSNNKKIALIVGGLLILGVAAYLYTKRNK
jgi:hypothetical protein